MSQDPETPKQWQTAVDGAAGALALHAARLYGLVQGGPQVHVRRCLEILEQGKARGITPRADAIKRFVEAIMAAKGNGSHEAAHPHD